MELDGLLEAEDPLDWLGDTVYTADGFGRLELELAGRLTVIFPAGLLTFEGLRDGAGLWNDAGLWDDAGLFTFEGLRDGAGFPW